jgi:hypothetical protein
MWGGKDHPAAVGSWKWSVMTALLQRRSFLVGLGASLVCAPAIVRASSLMPVKAVEWPDIFAGHEFTFRTSLPQAAWRQINMGSPAFFLTLKEWGEIDRRLSLINDISYLPVADA